MRRSPRLPSEPTSRTLLVVLATLAILWATLGSSCAPPSPTPPDFEIDITSVSDPTPGLNDLYRIEWTYTPSERFQDQFVELQSLTIEGRVASKFFGCAPPEFYPAGNPPQTDCEPEVQAADCGQQIFTNTCRQFTGRFSGPVVFTITAQDSDGGRWKRKAITLRMSNSHFRVGNLELSNAGYPNIGTAQSSAKQIEFMKYFAVYNGDRQANSVVRDLRDSPFDNVAAGGFNVERPFFASSTSLVEAERFGYSTGSRLPFLNDLFLLSPAGTPYAERDILIADAVVVAATIQLDGSGLTKRIKTADGEEDVLVVEQGPITITVNGTRTSSFPRRTLMVQIDLGRNLGQGVPRAEPMTPTQVAFGNVDQGLVMPAFLSVEALQNGFIEDGSILLAPGSPAGVTAGNIPATGVVFQATTATQPVLNVSAVLNEINWAGVPAFADDSLDPLLGCRVADPAGC